MAADADAAATPGSRPAVIPAAAAAEEAELLLVETADAGAAAEEADRILRAAWRAALRPTPSVWDMAIYCKGIK